MVSRKLPGPEAVRYFPDWTYRLRWLPQPGKDYWAVMRGNEHVADMFRGKAGWCGIIFGNVSIRCKAKGTCMQHIAGLVLNPNH